MHALNKNPGYSTATPHMWTRISFDAWQQQGKQLHRQILVAKKVIEYSLH